MYRVPKTYIRIYTCLSRNGVKMFLSHTKAKQKQKLKNNTNNNNNNNNKEIKKTQNDGRRQKTLAKQPRYVKSELFVPKARKARSRPLQVIL